MKISCNVNTRDAILNFCCLLYLIGRLICSEWINTCVPTLSMKRHLFRSFAYNEFMTLLGNFVRTSCCQEQSQACKRRQRTLGSRRPRDAQRVYPIEPFHSERHPPMEPGEQGTDEAIGAKERSMDASELAKRNGLGKIRQKRKIGNQATGLRGKSNA